jgi:dihydropteroate synthase
MVRVASQTGVAICAMHMQGTPQTMQDNPTYDDVVDEIYDYLTQRLNQLCEQGISKKKICLDPGIGFGKSHEHNLELIRSARRFLDLGQPILVGHSRKGFIAKLLGSKSADRTAGTLGVSLALAKSGIHILRVHDVAQTRDALVLFEASGGLS